MYTSREQVSCIFFVCGGIDSTYQVQTYTSEVTCGTILVVFLCIGICV